MALLEYENQIFLDAFHEDGLLIMARGLGLDRLFCSFLKLYTDPGNLVLVLNTSAQEEDYFLEQLQNSGTKPLPKVITTEYSANDRFKIYMEGGVLFITSRILVVDLLTDRVPVDLVTGILVNKAHRIMESCQEAFILRLFRQKNKKGFIKAFSDSPLSFTAGFCHVERVMKSLFVKKLFLWPRFHANVVATMEKHKVDVVELHVPLTPTMTACQTALLDLIAACVKELKRCNPTLDTDEVTTENAITRGFDKIIKLHLNPVWHQLGSKTKQLVSDIRTLQLLLRYLIQYDCVNFYNLVNSLRTNEKVFGSNSGWLFMDAADSLFVHAKSRVFSNPKPAKKLKKDEKETTSSSKPGEPLLEEPPKWQALKEVLQEIEEENATADPDLGPGRVLVAAADDRTCNQLKEYLCDGGRQMLKRLFEKTISMKSSANRNQGDKSPQKGKWRGRNPIKKDPTSLTLTQMVDSGSEKSETTENSKQEKGGTSAKEADSFKDSYYGVLKSPLTILHPLRGNEDPNSLIRTLAEVQPRYVVLYDADMVFVRQLEVYRACRPGQPLRVYFLVYHNSTEEQSYLTTLRKEKEAFEFLIKEKATMVIPEERDGRLEDDPELARDTKPANATVNTRKGGFEQAAQQQKIIVDMREFRSELPSLIHRRGIDIEPVTIEVGDYILTPDICVERKSVSDLIGSLNNGRLYNQSVSMCRFYKRPVLLIEFDPNKSFALQGKYPISGELSSTDTTSKLALLTIHFPRLRVLWCQSPYATAELFEELKRDRAQPDAATAAAISDDTDTDLTSTKYSHGPQELLLKMPGITSKNIFLIMNHVDCIADLVDLSEEKLTEILDSASNAKLLHSFLHKSHTTAIATADGANTKPTAGGSSKSGGKLPVKGRKKR